MIRLRRAFAAASLRTRVLAVTGLVLATALAVMGFAGTTLLRSYLIGRADTQLRAFASLTDRSRPLPARPLPPPARDRNQALPSAFLAEVVSPSGHIDQVLRAGQQRAPLPRLTASQLRSTTSPITIQSGAHSWRVLALRPQHGRYAVVAVSLDDVLPVVGQLALIEVAAGLVALAVLMVSGFWLVRASLAPLRGIERTAQSIAGGDLSQRVPDDRPRTEVGRLAAALNTMLGRIEAAYRAREEGEQRAQDSEERMRRFVADASHELRTPLTSIRGFADFYAQQGETADRAEIDRLMNRIRQESARMGDLVDDLLLLAHLDEKRALQPRPVDLASLAADAVLDLRAVQPARRLAMHVDPDPVVVNADEARLRQVIGNLLANAVQHTPPGTPIDVTVQAGSGEAHLAVADQGPGMTQWQAGHMFERFYRGDLARGRASGGGSGLGLSIVAGLVGAHGGRVGVDTAFGHGCVFHVWLPLAGPPAGAHLNGTC
jgi:two-component system OmpR family sensor kinase